MNIIKMIGLMFGVLLFCSKRPLAQFTGTITYKSSTITGTDTAESFLEVRYSPNKILIRNGSSALQVLHCFDERMMRSLDTVRHVRHELPIILNQSGSLPKLIDSVQIDGAWQLHYRTIQQTDLVGLAPLVITDYWVSKSIPVLCGGITNFYSPFANGTGFALSKMRKVTEIQGQETTVTETYLDKVETKPYTDKELRLVGSVGQ